MVRTKHFALLARRNEIVLTFSLAFQQEAILRLYLVPSAPPSNITGQNTGSTSLKITWEDIPKEERNGIILNYEVYMKLSSSGSYHSPTIVSSKSYVKTGLQYWTLYDIRIAGNTSAGRGVMSNTLQVRTDEDSKSTLLH